MDDEWLDELAPGGAATGRRILKAEAHRTGAWHRAAHVWIVNREGKLLLQRRASSKDNHRDLWDVSAAGHVSAGEDSLTCAVPETREELGIAITRGQLEYLATLEDHFVLNGGTYIDHEVVDVFLARLDPDPQQIRSEDVSEAAFVTLDELESRVAKRDPTLVPHDEEHALLLRRLRS